jgi:ABC-type multidrug transport system ATPase subunit
MWLCKIRTSLYIFDFFSGGEKRRVSFAAAVMSAPPLLVLDEPTAGMDPILG